MEILQNSHKDVGLVKPLSLIAAQFLAECVGYCPTEIRALPGLAAELGLGSLWAKLEVDRFGLNSFKILGAKWALHQYLATQPDRRIRRLITATDGNHGRAVAQLGRQERLSTTIYVPEHTSTSIIRQIGSEGADVIIVPGTYDDAVDAAYEGTASLGEDALLLSDTSPSGSDSVAEWIIQGYETIFAEAGMQLSTISNTGPDIVLLQIGVGGLAAAASRYFRRHGGLSPALIGVESVAAAAAMRSVESGSLVRVEALPRTVMSGINAGLLSATAWPDLKYGFDWFMTIEDSWCHKALDALSQEGIFAGPTGAAGMAGILALAQWRQNPTVKNKNVLVIVTEGNRI
ncbi:MAG: Diaminopropionate ammonia-lyase [Syntrophorhabdus sp. PtaU1.Bin002]|nr:MAG: Diaminopropionate ammonia-lyase [Syntrophorhabdus sp. PtaU1.Bin002]